MKINKLGLIYKDLRIFDRKFSNIWFSLVIFVSIFIYIHHRISKVSNTLNVKNVNSNYELIKTKCNYGENGPRILCAVFTHKNVHKTTLPPVNHCKN